MREIQNIQDYQAIINEGKPVLLDFYADWCGPCKALMPTVEKLAEKYESNFTIAKVNVDKNPELAVKFQVRGIPALFFLQDGEIVDRLGGLQSESTLDSKIQQFSTVKTQ